MTPVARDGGAGGQWRGPGGRGLRVGCVGCSRRQPGPGDFVGGVGENVCTPNAMAGNPQHAGASRRRSSWDWALAWDLNALPPARSALFWGLGRGWDQNGFPRPCARGRRPELRGVPPGPGWLLPQRLASPDRWPSRGRSRTRSRRSCGTKFPTGRPATGLENRRPDSLRRGRSRPRSPRDLRVHPDEETRGKATPLPHPEASGSLASVRAPSPGAPGGQGASSVDLRGNRA